MEVPYPALSSSRAVAAVVSAGSPVLTPFTASPSPSPASITPAVFKTGKDGGQEDKEMRKTVKEKAKKSASKRKDLRFSAGSATP